MDRRTINRPVELRTAGEQRQPKSIVGYAAVFYRAGDADTEYELWPGAYERILPGAFDRALDDPEIRATFDHQALLGRNGAGTLRLSVDDIGLRYEITASETTAWRDTVEHLRLGNVVGSSFGFQVRSSRGEEWSLEKRGEGWIEIRELKDLVLTDVGPVALPAYRATSASARGVAGVFAEARSARDNWSDQMKARREEEAAREAVLREMQLANYRNA